MLLQGNVVIGKSSPLVDVDRLHEFCRNDKEVFKLTCSEIEDIDHAEFERVQSLLKAERCTRELRHRWYKHYFQTRSFRDFDLLVAQQSQDTLAKMFSTFMNSKDGIMDRVYIVRAERHG